MVAKITPIVARMEANSIPAELTGPVVPVPPLPFPAVLLLSLPLLFWVPFTQLGSVLTQEFPIQTPPVPLSLTH